MYHTATVTAPIIQSPPEKRVPFGWQAFSVAVRDGYVTLRWPDAPFEVEKSARLRLTVALDDREEKRLDVIALTSRKTLASFDLRYAQALQLFEVHLTAESARAASTEGVGLYLSQGTSPLWLLAETVNAPALQPHLLFEASQSPRNEFFKRLLSRDTIQPLSWLEGCILDGLYDLYAVLPRDDVNAALEARLGQFTNEAGDLIYEDPCSRPSDQRMYGIEATLPFAVWAKVWPDHPVLRLVKRDWRSRQDDRGVVTDGRILSAEGSYTVAYPMAVLAKTFPELADCAVTQLRARRDALVSHENIFLRAYSDGQRTFKNWSRGVAWYLLGLVRTLKELDRTDLTDLVAEANRVSAWVTAQQREDGLWHCFLDDATTPPDTSGSAGMAAALALGVKHSYLPVSAGQAAAITLRTLETKLSPDGFLTGAAQSNRGGEALQRSDYRVLSPMAMGLMAQLIGALTRPVSQTHGGDLRSWS